MSLYKCISCGETKESESLCSCPTCGYRMYKEPYNRREVLISEIRGFIKHLEIDEISSKDISHYRIETKKGSRNAETESTNGHIISKEKDDARFPDFNKIRDYVCSSKKTEAFREHLDTSIEQIQKHIHEPYTQEYKVNLDKIKTRLNDLDQTVNKAIDIVGIKKVIVPEIELPEISLLYKEIPDEILLNSADELLDELRKLSDKIQKFIRQNNIYGTAFQHKTKITFKSTDEKESLSDLKKCINSVSKVVSKKYIVDIFSDGSEELDEMLRVLWNSLSAIMTLPVLSKSWEYTFDDGRVANNQNIHELLLKEIHERYVDLNAALNDDGFFVEKNEDQIFEIYDKMIELDSYGFMGINKGKLLKIGESENALNSLIGLTSIKESIKKVKAYALSNKDNDKLNIHMCFYGNPGTGKTEVARIVAGILYENKILPTKKVIEVDRSGLVSQYFGATAEKTQEVIQRAMGGVLFVDEAYALGNNSDTTGLTDYGREAIDTLVKAMEDYRGKFCVILAGYKNEMLKMISANPGMRSRIQFELDFPNYSREELGMITQLMLNQRKYIINDLAKDRILDITDIKRKSPNFANAREIRNIVDQVIMCQNLRSAGSDDREIGIVDVNRYVQDAKINLPTVGNDKKKILSAEEELEELIGLDAVKRMIKKIKAYAKRNQGQADFNLHMCFYGNPGTGKTEVARILSRILYEAGILSEAKLVETDAYGLLGKYVGETAPKTEGKINEAMNGVLFIDEAYGLTSSNASSGGSTNYGEEAITVLLKEMEDHRGQFCVILAGYKDEMKTMINSNPGVESRIQFTLDFPDYNRIELGEITKAFLSKKQYVIENDALELLLDITDYYRAKPNFANARTVRNILDQVIMNQNLRTEDFSDNNTIVLEDVNDYLMDEDIDLTKKSESQRRIGFVY